MALIIKGDMPKGCGWDCDLWSEGLCAPLQKSVDEHTIDSDCPILCEIPDKHGRLIDADALQKELAEHGHPSEREWYFAEVGQFIDEAENIVEATE